MKDDKIITSYDVYKLMYHLRDKVKEAQRRYYEDGDNDSYQLMRFLNDTLDCAEKLEVMLSSLEAEKEI